MTANHGFLEFLADDIAVAFGAANAASNLPTRSVPCRVSVSSRFAFLDTVPLAWSEKSMLT